MPKALVCINTDFFAADEVLEKLRACKEVEEAFKVYGVYDIIAKINAETTEGLLDVITTNIKELRNVQATHTMLIVEPDYPQNEEHPLLA